ncbi:MAG: 4-hydroxy-tetrahydrodipicolinate synthase [Pseudomonadota bacterium]|nr:MAG: 4-hydroxy-tetrahydrodipicolinate synthase [Pseudomonadota bacterium]
MFKGSLVALVTPMQPDGAIDFPAWRRLIDWHLQSGTDGLVVGGTTGESVNLTGEEFSQLLATAVEQVAGRIAVLAGTGSSSTEQTVTRSRLAADLGADAALVVTPAYNRPTQRGLIAHFTTVADSAGLPIVLYNVPSRTAVDLLPETVAKLAGNAGIVAIKEAVGDAGRLAALLDTGLAVLSGDDPSCCQRMLEGASGVVSVAANVVPEAVAELCALALQGREDGARRIDGGLRELYAFLAIEPNPVPVKWLLAESGWIPPGLRLPLVVLDRPYQAQGQQLIEQLALDARPDLA